MMISLGRFIIPGANTSLAPPNAGPPIQDLVLDFVRPLKVSKRALLIAFYKLCGVYVN